MADDMVGSRQRRGGRSEDRQNRFQPGTLRFLVKFNRAEQILDMSQLPSCPSAQLVTEKDLTRPLTKIWRGRGAALEPPLPGPSPGLARAAMPGAQA
jgi:hypothetical protein